MSILGCALDYCQAIDSYASRNRDLHPYKIYEEEWTSISMVSSWLKSFCSATTQMSATKVPMLSTTHAIFCGLQDDIKMILHSYEGMKLDYENNLQLAEYLDLSKKDLHMYYESHYANQHSGPSQVISQASQTLVSSATAPSHLPQKNITSRFH